MIIRTFFAPPVRSILEVLFIVSSSLTLGGCIPPWKLDRPSLDVPIPATYRSAPEGASAVPANDWIRDFADPDLPGLVDEALERNHNLKVAAARVRAARAGAQIAGADLFPQFDAEFGARRFQRVLTGSSRLVGSGVDGVSNDRVNDFDIGLGALWEADLWGRLRNIRDAAAADYAASDADFAAARLSLAANTAIAWFTVKETQAQVELARSTLQAFESTYEIIERGFSAGTRTALELRLSRANVAGARSALSALMRERDAAKKNLDVLLGRYPSGDVDTGSSVPSISAPIPAGLPSELLSRRPDLVAASFRLEAAFQDLKASTKELLPSIRLTASGGINSDEFEDLLDFDRLVWSIAANVIQPVFQGGRIRGQIELSSAREQEALELFAQQVLDAFNEVERALAAEAFFRQQVAALETAAEESRRAEQLAIDEYEKGLVDIITVLDSQRRSFESQSTLIQTRYLLLQNRVNLYLALGGDFDSAP